MSKNKINLTKNFPVFIFMIVVIIVVNGCFFIVDYRDNVAMRDDIIQQTHDMVWDAVEDGIIKEYSSLSSDAKYLSKKIEASILRKYAGNLDQLKEDFDNGTFDQTLYDLFKKEILNDSSSPNQSTIAESFNYILGFKHNLLAVFTDDNKEGLTTNMSWEEYFNSSANIPLNEKLIHNIKNRNLAENILLYQTNNLPKTTELVTEHNLESLKIVYDKHGLKGLKNFDFVNVSYITEYGDIFGTNDYLYLQSVSNHKMILVKTSNVYDSIIDEISPDIKQIKTSQELVLNQITDSIARKSLEFITLTLYLIVLIAISSIVYNRNLINK